MGVEAFQFTLKSYP